MSEEIPTPAADLPRFVYLFPPMDIPTTFELIFCPGECCRACAVAKSWAKAARVGGEELGKWYEENRLEDVKDVLFAYLRFRGVQSGVDLTRPVDETLPFPRIPSIAEHRADALRYALSGLRPAVARAGSEGSQATDQTTARVDDRTWSREVSTRQVSTREVTLPRTMRFPERDIEVFVQPTSLPDPQTQISILTIGYYELEECVSVRFGSVRYCSVGEAIRREKNGENVDIVLNSEHPRARFCEMFFRDVKGSTASRWRSNSGDGWSHRDSRYGVRRP